MRPLRDHKMTKSRYRSVDETKIIETLERLRSRIGERFPGSGLYHVTEELIAVARETSKCAEYLRSPHWPSRISALLVQYFNDPVLLGAVNEIETLTSGLSRKIWQKIQLLDSGRIAAGA